MISAGMLLCDLSNLQGCHTANAEDQCIRLAAPVEELHKLCFMDLGSLHIRVRRFLHVCYESDL